MDWELLLQLLLIAGVESAITCFVIQETKGWFKSSKWIKLYSLFVNMVLCVPFCLTFTSVNALMSLWVGLFSFVGADELYKSLEGKVKSWKDLVPQEKIEIIER